MDKNALTTAMKASISEVMETMFFTPVEFVPTKRGEGVPGGESGGVAARLDFDGPVRGCFYIQVPESLARNISADFMGMETGSVTREDMAGTVKEMINMMAGNTLSTYDSGMIFDLGVPQMVSADELSTKKTGEDDVIRLGIQTLASRMTMVVAEVLDDRVIEKLRDADG